MNSAGGGARLPEIFQILGFPGFSYPQQQLPLSHSLLKERSGVFALLLSDLNMADD